jgi:hypothetical protein
VKIHVRACALGFNFARIVSDSQAKSSAQAVVQTGSTGNGLNAPSFSSQKVFMFSSALVLLRALRDGFSGGVVGTAILIAILIDWAAGMIVCSLRACFRSRFVFLLQVATLAGIASGQHKRKQPTDNQQQACVCVCVLF